jgi:hypothetical protein
MEQGNMAAETSNAMPKTKPDSSKGGSGMWLIVSFLLLILVAVLAIGGWYFFLREEDEGNTDSNTDDEISEEVFNNEEEQKAFLLSLGLDQLSEEELNALTDAELSALVDDYIDAYSKYESGELDLADWAVEADQMLAEKLSEAFAEPFNSDEIAVAGLTEWELVDVQDYGATLEPTSTEGTFGTEGCTAENGRYVSVTLRVTNTGSKSLNLYGPAVVDADNSMKYENNESDYSYCQLSFTPDNITEVAAGETETVAYLFDLPTENDLFLRVSDDNFFGEDITVSGEEYAFIALEEELQE